MEKTNLFDTEKYYSTSETNFMLVMSIKLIHEILESHKILNYYYFHLGNDYLIYGTFTAKKYLLILYLIPKNIFHFYP